MDAENQLTVKILCKSSWRDILDLSVSQNQKSFIEKSSKCLKDAETNAYNMTWNFYGVYLGELLIGFAMHGRQEFRPLPCSKVWLDRFMIDQRYQGKGYGKKSMELILQKLYIDYKCNKIYLSAIEDNVFAISLYEKLGFKKTRFKDSKGERIMTRKK